MKKCKKILSKTNSDLDKIIKINEKKPMLVVGFSNKTEGNLKR